MLVIVSQYVGYADSRNIIYAGDCFSISMLIHGNIIYTVDCFSISMLIHGKHKLCL